MSHENVHHAVLESSKITAKGEVAVDVEEASCKLSSPHAYIVWSDLSVHIAGAKHDKRCILEGATGYAQPGSIVAVMGPSGSGKSTLLDALAGRLAPDAVRTGDVMLNGERKTSLSYGTAAYVTQEDVLIGTLTVRESLLYSANLRLPDTATPEEKRMVVDSTIRAMGLSARQHSFVGTFFVRGLSGGEKRRLSIALHILTRPPLLFLDEPTSGLDSAAAYCVVRALKNLAKDGRTVISSIHQPSSEVFQLFDHLTLLSGGHTVFFGQAQTASQFFASSQYPCPSMRNPSDHYLQIINADFDADSEELGDPLKARQHAEQVVKTLAAAYRQSEHAVATRATISHIMSNAGLGNGGAQSVLVTGGSKGHASFVSQCKTLTQRSFVHMTRDPAYYWLRVAMYALMGLCIGTIFWQVGLLYSSILARASILFFGSAFLTFMAIGGFPSFVEDMRVQYHERLSGHYGVGAFVVGNTVASLPLLFLIALSAGTPVYLMAQLHPGFGRYAYFVLMLFAVLTCVESIMMAVSSVVGRNFLAGIVIGAGIQGVFMMLSGYFRLTKDLPKPVWRYPGSYFSLQNYAIQGLFKNDFLGLVFENSLGPNGEPIGPGLPGEYVLEHVIGMENSRGKWGDLSIVFGMTVFYRVLFLTFIKLSESLWPRLRVKARELFSKIMQTKLGSKM